ncbi:MAG: diguanylate cyclase [Desulfobulbaceae bacterium]|nr:diguanylate cyclase [Desulfobulbaceae bacterium]
MILIVVWLCIPGLFLYNMEMSTRAEERRLAQSTAKAFFQQIVISRLWNASHGGVYVPVTTTSPPNKYLPAENRVLTADNGTKLALINPSYMTRQLAELAHQYENGIQFHLTSLNPIRPENKPTEWEEKWLKAFEQGSKSEGEFFNDGNTTWFRYMEPLLTGKECLQCHAQHGYKRGDIRGGLSVSVPYPTHNHLHLFVGYGAVVLIGLALIILGVNFYDRKRRLFEATFNSPVPTCVTDQNFTILMANQSYWDEFGAHPPDKQKVICYEHRPGESCHTENCPLTRIMAGSNSFAYEASKKKGGTNQYFIVTSKPLFDAKNKPIGIIESFQEITERKQAEEALAASNRKLESLSNTDGLTGIANRRHFDEVLAREYARHARSGAKLSLILLDIDYFKSFNDCYGHIAGDECLQRVAKVIDTHAARPADLAARYGGEEFACILPETDRRGALAIAEKIRLGIMDLAIPHQRSQVAACVTASLGVETVQCRTGGSALELLTQVDELLYCAKSSGRNRIESAVPSEMEEELKTKLVQLAWKDSLACGNEVIDAEHQALFHISNKLLEAVLAGRPNTEISMIIGRLFTDISQHFQNEEAILKEIDFPNLAQHAEAHAKLLTKGLALAKGFKASTLTAGDVFQFLAYEVVMLHMLKEDREFFPYINDESATGKES